MSRFTFRLQRLLDLRHKKEQEVAGVVAVARATAEDAAHQQQDLSERRDATRQEMLPARGQTVRVGELHEVAIFVQALDARVSDAKLVTIAAERSVQEKVIELGAAMRDRRILDRLKGRRTEEWRVEDARQERDVMDAIARDRYTDAKKPFSSPD